MSNDKTLASSDQELFNEIWTRASDLTLWDFSELARGCEASQRFIEQHYTLPPENVASIVRAISYQWK